MFGARTFTIVRLAVSVCFVAAAMLPPGAFLCVDACGHARFEVAGFDLLSPVDEPGHRDEGLPDCPGGGRDCPPCHDYRLGMPQALSRGAGVGCPGRDVSFAPLLPIEGAAASAAELLAAKTALDLGGPPDCRPQRVALRI